VAFVIAGFYGGGYLAIVLVQLLGWPMSDTVVCIVGGIIGALFVATSQGYKSYNTFSRQIYEKMEPTLKKDFKRLIEQSNL
jgi:hypothetical protein